MNYASLANPGVFNQPIYIPGKPISQVALEYGLDTKSIDKLASNENPFGPSPLAVQAVMDATREMHLYPDGSCTDLKLAVSHRFDLEPDNFIFGNGSNEIIELLGHAFLRPGLNAVVGSHSFIVYRLVAKLFGADVIDVPMKGFAHDLEAMLDAINEETRVVFVASPNNPTGMANSEEALLRFIDRIPEHVIFCFDEAYAEYLKKAPNLVPSLKQGKKIICMRTFSKIYGLGGLRVGYGYADKELIGLLNRVRQPFNVNLLAQKAALSALSDEGFVDNCRLKNELGRTLLLEQLTDLGIKCYGGSANFVLACVGDGQYFFEELQKLGTIVRPLDNYNLPDYIRITIGTESENVRLVTHLKSIQSKR